MQKCGLSCHSREVKPVEKEKWLLCSVCKNKTRIRIRNDTELKNFLKDYRGFLIKLFYSLLWLNGHKK